MEEKYMPIRNSRDCDESFAAANTAHAKSQRLYKTKLLTWILLVLTSFAFLANVYFLFRHSWTPKLSLEDGLYPNVIPSFPLETVSFEENVLYTSAPSLESEKAWGELMPPGKGFVFVQEGRERGLPVHGEVTPWGEVYSVTVFHQLHCLTLLRRNYWEAFSRAFDQDDLEALKQFAKSKMNDKHANHCFDYLRQSLQCSADMSIEWPKAGTQIVNGWGVPHLCKSWEAVMDYMEKNHSNGTAVEKHASAGGANN